jgi:hypothetical protein
LAQLTSADTQNQLAQMQMQEHQQLAPYRMQQAQTQAASAQLTYDQAKEAQDFIAKSTAAAAEHSGGKAPTHPVALIKAMSVSTNPLVQAHVKNMVDAWKTITAYENQIANEEAYAQDQRTGGAAPTPAGAPAVVSTSSVNGTQLPMVAAGAATVPAPNVGLALSRFVAGTKDLPDGSRVGPYFSIAGQPVSEEEYTRQREALMLPQQTNNLAAQVAPAVAAAPAMNAMIPAVASALQNADAIKKEIENGDDKYARGGIPAPGWKAKRELLVEAYKQALKPGRVGATSEFEQLLNASGMSETEKQDMRKAKLAKETAKPADKVETKSDFEKLLDASGMSETEKQDMRKAKLAKETAKPEEKKNEFEQLLDASGMSETEKQDMRKAKLAKETAKPADKVEAKSDFEKLLDASGMSEEEKQTARKAKITKETAAPVSQAERKTDFEKLLEDAGLSDTEKQDMRKAKLAKETTASAGSKSQFEQMLDASGLPESKKSELRRQWLLKETRVPVAGEGKGKPPSGYRYDASGENLEIIPGGPADKQEKAKAIPPQIITAIITNDQSVRKIQDALALLEQNKDAVGLKGSLPQAILNRADPKGIATRAAVADIGSLVLHDRSGAAVTASEEPRLLPFIPVPADPYEAAKVKLQRMLKYAKEQQDALKQTYSPDNGYKSNISAPAAKPATVSNW